MIYKITYTIQIEAKDRSEAKRIALQDCPNENYDVSVWEFDEKNGCKGRVM